MLDRRLLASRLFLFLFVMSIGLTADLVTKSMALGKYPPMGMQPVWWIDGILGIQTSTNGGALFGIGQGGSLWFALFSIIAFAAIIYFLFAKGLARNGLLTLTLALISGGILGNFYDRIGLGYDPRWNAPELRLHVRDWIHFRLEGVSFFDPWPNFNIADSLLVCGACLLFLLAIFGKNIDASLPETTDAEKPDET